MLCSFNLYTYIAFTSCSKGRASLYVHPYTSEGSRYLFLCMLHYLFSSYSMCDLRAKLLLLIHTVWTFIKIISIPEEELFFKTAVGWLVL